ncbi:hypothetical protein ACHWQZ_G015225 [Mnemiopsis leidyi]
MVVSKSRRKGNGVWAATKRRPRKSPAAPAAVCLEAKLGELKKSAEIRLEGRLSDYLNTKGADVLWGSNIRLTENDLQEILPPESPCSKASSSPEKNVITECAMCNEELTTNHVCREYLERLQPHFSTVPKGGHEITLTQTSEECRKNLSSLENGIYDEDEGNLFHFNPASAHIDVIAKTEYDHESSVDNINVSVGSKSSQNLMSDIKPSVPFATSWISAVYSKDLFTYDQYQSMLSQRSSYCYPVLTKLETGAEGEHELDPHSPTPVSEGERPPSVTLTTEYYHLPPPTSRPKFVRSVKRLKRDAYYNDYTLPVEDCNQNPLPKDPQSQYPDHRAYSPSKKRTVYPTSYKSAEVTKNSSVGGDDPRHEAASPNESDQPRKKRKYVRRTTKEEQIENGTALWQFLMRKLEDPCCRGWIRWTGNDLEFKVLDQKEAAKQWGLCKKRSKMTFDKFSRSMRFYYSKGILVHNPDKRLTYIFCRQPHDPVYTEMLERVMKTLPPNTLHCTAVCIDPEHEHEKIKLLVRKRPKKAKIRESGTENSNSRGESENESPTDCGSRSIGLQCDSNQSQPEQEPEYEEHVRGSLIPEYVMSYQNEHGSVASPPYSNGNMTDSGFCSSSPYSDYRRRPEQEMYNSSPMAALIAAASQAVAVPIPGPRGYPSMEIPASPSLQSTPQSYTPSPESGSRNPPCGTPHTPQLSADYTEMMVSAMETGELRYEELSQRKVPDNSRNTGTVDYYGKTNGNFDNRVSDMSHPAVRNSVTSYGYNTEPTQQTPSSVTILDSGYNAAPEGPRFIQEAQLSEDVTTAIPSSNSIPKTQSIDQDLETSLDESQGDESTLSESQLSESVDVAPEIPVEGEVVHQSKGTDGFFSYDPQSSGHISSTGERSARISQDSGFCEASSTFGKISQECSELPQQSHELTS